MKNAAAMDASISAVLALLLLAAPMPPRPYLTAGGVSKLWYGGGEDSVHSSPSAPSHTLSVALAPPLTHFSST